MKTRTAKLSELKSHPSWAELLAILEERKTKRFGAVQRQLIEGVAIDQRYLDRLAGFFKGAEWILDNPDLSEQSLATAVKKAKIMGLAEGD
jgi:hypothetical protein